MRTCDLCSSASFSNLPFYYELEGSHLQGKKCKKCGLMFLDPQPTAEQIERMYSKEYFTDRENYDREKKQQQYMDLAREIDFSKVSSNKYTDYLLKNFPGKAFRYLEVGCGPGFTLKMLRDNLNWQVQGLEISGYSADYGRTQLGLPIVTGSIEAYNEFKENEFDLLYMGDVIEHLTSPATTIAKFKKILEPGGLLMLSLPATMNLPAVRLGTAIYSALGRNRKMDIKPYHLFEFTPATIKALLQKQGFDVLHLDNYVKQPSKIRLGGNKLEAAGKLLGQYPTYYLNKLTGSLGDRIFVVARNNKPAAPVKTSASAAKATQVAG